VIRKAVLPGNREPLASCAQARDSTECTALHERQLSGGQFDTVSDSCWAGRRLMLASTTVVESVSPKSSAERAIVTLGGLWRASATRSQKKADLRNISAGKLIQRIRSNEI
jgi:hypothetical protein